MPKKAYGSVKSVAKYNKANGIIEPTKEPKEASKKSKPMVGAFVISDETITDVSQDELDLLDNIILKHKPHDVYMRSDIEAYDSMYFTDNSDIKNGLLKEVRNIRRVHRNYRSYLNAIYLRDAYLKSLQEEYGKDDTSIMRFRNETRTIVIPSGTFIPPVPIYSRHAEDYKAVQNGTFSIVDNEMQASEDEVLAVFDRIISQIPEGFSPSFVTGVMTDRRVMNAELNDNPIEDSRFEGARSVNLADLDSMQKYMRYWFKKDEQDKEDAREKVPFPKSEEGMRQLTDLALGMYILEEHANRDNGPDDKEMVYDEVLKKPMTRGEFNRRNALRMFCSLGNWDLVKIMSQKDVGSKYERRLARKQQKRSNKVKRQAESFFGDLEGDDVVDIEELRNYLFSGGDE